ncbi:MAG: hypothetical protein JWQ43_4144 [Glaciihabitans sp.]|nr:hypothetical protein [Glaciihabitans sp.]
MGFLRKINGRFETNTTRRGWFLLALALVAAILVPVVLTLSARLDTGETRWSEEFSSNYDEGSLQMFVALLGVVLALGLAIWAASLLGYSALNFWKAHAPRSGADR